MKRIVLLISFLAAVALCASAQMYLDFHDMHYMPTPVQISGAYPAQANLYWNNFLAVTPGIWSGAGPGFWVDPSTYHNNVMFLGGPPQSVAVGSIVIKSIQLNPVRPTFQPISMTLSAGWAANSVLVTAYLDTNAVGNVTWNLTTTPQIFKFPPEWLNVTRLVFTPDPSFANAVHPRSGSMVMYNFLLVQH